MFYMLFFKRQYINEAFSIFTMAFPLNHSKSIWDCLVSDFLGAVFEHRYWVPAHSYILPLLHLGAYVVFLCMCAPRHNMLTLLGGAECTSGSWNKASVTCLGFL